MVTLTENEYKNRKNHIVESCSFGVVDMVKSCLHSECAKCKGNCCLNYPCTMSPREFIDIENIDYMTSVLDTGLLAISPCNENCSFYVIRPRGVKDLDTITTGFVLSPNSCILRGSKGCILEPVFRPADGLLLLPNEEEGHVHCESHYSDFSILDDWLKYQDILRKLRNYYKDKEIEKPKATEETFKTYKLALLGNCQKETK